MHAGFQPQQRVNPKKKHPCCTGFLSKPEHRYLFENLVSEFFLHVHIYRDPRFKVWSLMYMLGLKQLLQRFSVLSDHSVRGGRAEVNPDPAPVFVSVTVGWEYQQSIKTGSHPKGMLEVLMHCDISTCTPSSS
jgi:hypothetical protein